MKKTLLLVVELLAVAALFAGALKLWQVRQDLHNELAAAQQMEEVLQAAEQSLGQQALRTSKLAQVGGHSLTVVPAAPADAEKVAPRAALRDIGNEAPYGKQGRDYQR